MKKVIIGFVILILAILLFGCSSDSKKPDDENLGANDNGNSQVKEVFIDNSLVDDVARYEALDGKIYSKEDLKPIYVPYKVREIFPRAFNFDDINNTIGVKFLRTHDLGYYTYYDMEQSRFFVFFNTDGEVMSMLNYPLTPVSYNDFKDLVEGESTFEDVLKIDGSTMLYEKVAKVINEEMTERETPFSEHLISGDALLEIEYKREGDRFIVNEIKLDKTFISTVDRDEYLDGVYTVYP